MDFGVDILDIDQDPDAATMSHLATVISDTDAHQHSTTSDWVTRLADAHRTDERLRRLLPDEVAQEQDDAIESTVASIAHDLSARASIEFSRVLPDAPSIDLRITPPSLRFVLPAVKWTFGTAVVGLDELSRAERLWAIRSINQAIYAQRRELSPPADPLRPCIVLIDEPEAALHRAAESHMAHALVAHTEDPRNIIIAATHSPELLDSPTSHVVEVQRGGGKRVSTSRVQALDLADRAALDRLGLTPSDLLRWPRVILLVEGTHDQVLLEVFLGPRLRTARVMVIPLRGGSRLASTVDSQVLFDHTRAHMLALVDNQRASVIHETWTAAMEAAVQGAKQAAVEIVVAGIGDETEEARFISNWLTRALDRGLSGRVSATGLSKRDVIEYLNVEDFVPGASSWTALRQQHAAAREAKKGAKDFKKWLEERTRADFSPDNLARAAQRVPLPRDFDALINEIEAWSSSAG